MPPPSQGHVHGDLLAMIATKCATQDGSLLVGTYFLSFETIRFGRRFFQTFIYKVRKERALHVGRRNGITSQASVLASTESLGKPKQKTGITCWFQNSIK